MSSDSRCFNLIDAHGAELDLSSPTKSLRSKRNKDGYVDDSSLGVDGRDGRVMSRLTIAAQQHERTLFATGGKLALQKCTWVLVKWAWVEGKATLTTIDDHDQHSIGKLLLQQSETREEVEIPRLNPSNAYRTLGAWIAADGNQQHQLEVLQERVATWEEAIGRSSLTPKEKNSVFSISAATIGVSVRDHHN